MKKSLTSSVVLAALGLATLAASAAVAAPKHRVPLANDTPYQQSVVPPANAVVSEGKVVGVDPDPNIRTQFLHDPDPSGF
jgi:hypothetical protein